MKRLIEDDSEEFDTYEFDDYDLIDDDFFDEFEEEQCEQFERCISFNDILHVDNM